MRIARRIALAVVLVACVGRPVFGQAGAGDHRSTSTLAAVQPGDARAVKDLSLQRAS